MELSKALSTTKDEVLKLHAAGRSISFISHSLGKTYDSINRIINEHEAKIRKYESLNLATELAKGNTDPVIAELSNDFMKAKDDNDFNKARIILQIINMLKLMGKKKGKSSAAWSEAFGDRE